MMKRLFFLLTALLTLSVGMWANTPVVGDEFVDATSGLKFRITTVGTQGTVKAVGNSYSGTSYSIPATVSYQEVTFNVTEIGDYAFYHCNDLTSITIPASVTLIRNEAFYGCSNLTEVTFAEESQLQTIEMGTFFVCSSLTSIAIPASVTTIGYRAFYDCEDLETVTMTDNSQLESIGEQAFWGCGLTSITIPASVTEIGEEAFKNCNALYNVYVKWISSPTIPDLGAFTNIAGGAGHGPMDATLHVLFGYKSLYDDGQGNKWQGFGTVVDDISNTYIDKNGDEQTVDSDSVNVITNSSLLWGEAGQTTWYVVANDVLIPEGVICQGNVHLILADDAKLTATGGDSQAGIQVSGEGNSLSIYGQAAQTGKLNATGGKYGSGIGGGNAGSGSNITINGGDVTAIGGDGATGIGGGYSGSGSNITINGGTVTATGREYGSGIGGGYRGSGSDITINGGTVTATGGDGATSIGGGYQGYGSYITINGGDVTATGGKYGSGIGGGFDGSGSNITINGGTVTATGGESAAGIGGGYHGSGSNIFMPVNYRIKAGGTFIHNDSTDLADSLAGKRNVKAYPDGLLNERDTAFAAISAAVEGISDETILAMAAAAMEAVFQAESLNDINTVLAIVLAKINAIAEITTAREGIQNEFVNLWIDAAITDINKPGTDTEEKVNNIKAKIFDLIEALQEAKTEGKTEAAAELLGSMGEPCDDCPAVKVKKGDKTIILYTPEEVEFMKIQSEE